MKYKHIFFDLDHTIWDFDKNAEETLQELYLSYSLKELGIDCVHTFIEKYTYHNHSLWSSYHLGHITKEELREARFRNAFEDMGVCGDLIPEGFEDFYVRTCPTKTNLFPKAHETLSYLSGKYRLHLITNGFREQAQTKIELSDLGKYFDTVVISENVGVNKPHRGIFEYALAGAGAVKDESVMIGDSIEADIRGAMGYGIDAIFFNPGRLSVPEDIKTHINHLEDLIEIL